MRTELTAYREREELSQGELAEAVGVSRQTINAIERDRYDPSLELAFKLATYFDCHIEDLFKPDIDRSESN
ncbi:helix-turn-helix transcriptional regulator [Halorubrum sp. ARQ200]|jgi:putative transcriptional regulator|uniref:helix-turn-helix transcriptional regulator n=1 Tax=Halorubrum sp. ARQ200 TaxID=1855872 RepID=UPI0010F5ED05|nr:helix-turn-helix transcriptional regulator [Halorubrum sp. ARQ200]TKX43664.1 transcriptional regulator [Halorubrum sp. ARQ200]